MIILDPNEKNKSGNLQGKSTKYESIIVDRIEELLKSGKFTILEICEIAGIRQDTFYNWKRKYPEFEKIVNEAHEASRIAKFDLAMKAMHSKLQVRELEETETIYTPDKSTGEMVESKKIVRKKTVEPSDALLIFTAINLDPTRKFKNTNVASQDSEEYDNVTQTIRIAHEQFPE